MQCVVCNSANARRVYAALISVTNSGNDVGVSLENYACDAHRASVFTSLFDQCRADIEAAIAV
jgi:hypothetical protein